MRRYYNKQETEWTCGPAAMRTVLASLGIVRYEPELRKLMRATPKRGTEHSAFVRIAELYKLNYIVGRHSSVDLLRDGLKDGYRIIICYYLRKDSTGHYAIVQKISKNRIHLIDPWCGPDHSYSKSYFKKIWHDSSGERGWYIGVKQ